MNKLVNYGIKIKLKQEQKDSTLDKSHYKYVCPDILRTSDT